MRALDLIGGTEVVPEFACWEMLASHEVGRVVFSHDGKVEIFPVNYALHADHIFFATNAGRKLAGLGEGEIVFEVDWIERSTRSGWSVIVHGTARGLTEIDASTAAMIQRSWQPWTGTKDHLVVIQARSISGRRVAPI